MNFPCLLTRRYGDHRPCWWTSRWSYWHCSRKRSEFTVLFLSAGCLLYNRATDNVIRLDRRRDVDDDVAPRPILDHANRCFGAAHSSCCARPHATSIQLRSPRPLVDDQSRQRCRFALNPVHLRWARQSRHHHRCLKSRHVV